NIFRCSSVRNQAVESIYVILSKICVGPRKTGALSAAIALLFDNVEKTETRADIAGSYFHLLCRLLEFSRAQRLELPLILERLEAQFDWLDKAKQQCIANMESYPVDNLLSGHFDVAKDLIEFLSPEQKYHFGAAPNGRQLVKKLLDEFLLPSSRAFVELSRQSQQPASSIQRSVTMAASISHSAAGTGGPTTLGAPVASVDNIESSTVVESTITSDASSFANSSIPRSATTCISPTRCVPVCGSPESVSAAYDTLVALCSDSVENMRTVVGILAEMFYIRPDESSVEWEFAPVVALRGAGSYVGLKNGGATCYMNSVFQQLFMVESVRHALLNAPGTQADFEGDSDDEVLPLSKAAVTPASRKDYNMSIMRCVQMIFANLLGSQLQFYIPRRFWRRFRSSGTSRKLHITGFYGIIWAKFSVDVTF
uniref:USP domain-containing protein n=1 Tax=Plectus sambesii TaxID=2011161 RepID=A0A914UP72_9BILA